MSTTTDLKLVKCACGGDDAACERCGGTGLAIPAPAPSSPSPDLIERLNSRMESVYNGAVQGAEWQPDALCREAAAELSRLRADLAKAAEALQFYGFDDDGNWIDGEWVTRVAQDGGKIARRTLAALGGQHGQ